MDVAGRVRPHPVLRPAQLEPKLRMAEAQVLGMLLVDHRPGRLGGGDGVHQRLHLPQARRNVALEVGVPFHLQGNEKELFRQVTGRRGGGPQGRVALGASLADRLQAMLHLGRLRGTRLLPIPDERGDVGVGVDARGAHLIVPARQPAVLAIERRAGGLEVTAVPHHGDLARPSQGMRRTCQPLPPAVAARASMKSPTRPGEWRPTTSFLKGGLQASPPRSPSPIAHPTTGRGGSKNKTRSEGWVAAPLSRRSGGRWERGRG
jgi:hypothetical protein